jgi:ribosomal protein S18 acetylase RimI-like enzyme
VTVTTYVAQSSHLEDALNVWRRANEARNKAPSDVRVNRVRAKLADPSALVVIAFNEHELVGMALAEPGRAADGAGEPLPDLCHISMVFVDPDHWGKAIGGHLLSAVATSAGKAGYQRLQLWTGQSNDRAQRLYRRAGFELSGRTKQLDTGELVLHLTRPLPAGG